MFSTTDRHCSCLRYTPKVPRGLCHHDWTCYAECGSPTSYCGDNCTPCCSTGKCPCPCHTLGEYTCNDVFGAEHSSSAHEVYCDASDMPERPKYDPSLDPYDSHNAVKVEWRHQSVKVLGLPAEFDLQSHGKYTPRMPERIEEVPCPVVTCSSRFATNSQYGRGATCTHPARARALERARGWWRGIDPVSGAVWGTTVWVDAWSMGTCTAYFGCPLCGDTHTHGFSSREAAGRPTIRIGHCSDHGTSLAIPTGEAVTATVLARTTIAKHANPAYGSTRGFFAADVPIIAGLLGPDFGLKKLEGWF